MRNKSGQILFVIAAVFASSVFGYGGEDMGKGLPWHHEDITRRALAGDDFYEPKVKFTGGANSIAWHADFIDSYLYNPLFWAQGATESSLRGRTKAALVGFQDLAKLHFDDTFTSSGIRSNWERYASGTLTGLYWASEQGRGGDVAAGHHILGVSLHAVQDFYAHSNWASDPDRRCMTFFQTPKEQREDMTLWSGAYEKPVSGAPAHHGAYSLSCSVLKRDTMNSALGTLCTGLSPLQNTSLCESWRVCSGAAEVGISVTTPVGGSDARLFLNPPGIALDNTWLSSVQAKNRKLTDDAGSFSRMKDGLHFPQGRCTNIINSELGNKCESDTDLIFAGTKDVAIRASMEWVEYLEGAMKAMGKGAYWNKLKSQSSAPADRYAQFEDFSRLPYQFLAAGSYPNANPSNPDRASAASSDGWYLRLRIKTVDEFAAGTDADIFARVTVDGKARDIKLDYLPTSDKEGRVSNRLLVYDDFERGDDDAYTIGPFRSQPQSVALYNNSAGFGDVFSALATDFSNGVDEALTDARQMLIGIVGGNADFVGSKVKHYTADDLKARFDNGARATFADTLQVRGGDEGDHDVRYIVRNVSDVLSSNERDDGWIAINIRLDTLTTVNESEVDRGSNSDEPFVIFHVAPLNGLANASFTYLSEPFEDMDDGETASFPDQQLASKTVKIPPVGIVVVSTAIYESDDENVADRRTLMRKFVTGMDQDTQRPAAEFTDALGRSIAEDWTVEYLEVFAFQRGAYPKAGPVLARTAVGDVDGGEASRAFVLDWSRQADLMRGNAVPVLAFEGAKPNARHVLEGVWRSSDYWCGNDIEYEEVEVIVDGKEGTRLVAKKTSADGDECVGADEETFKGEFLNGILTGERYIVPPPYQRPKEVTDPLHPWDVIPNYADTSIHPRMDLEGNWRVEWADSEEPAAYATLTKGGRRECVGDQGCWYQFTRDPKAPWSVATWQARADGNHSRSGGAIEMSASGSMNVKWNYYMHGHWGGASQLAPTGDGAFTGGWSYGNDKKGGERWTRVEGRITETAVVEEGVETRAPLGKPVTLNTQFASHDYYMRGNRSAVRLRLYGDNLWGVQRAFIPWSSDLELSGVYYICEQQGDDGYPIHSDWMVCMEQGGVRGLEARMNVWSQAESKTHILYVNDQEVPFNLNVIDEPQRYAEWQPLKMEMKTCSVLQEIDRSYDEHPFRLIRQDFRRE